MPIKILNIYLSFFYQISGDRLKQKLKYIGQSASGKPQGFDPCIRRFESYLPSLCGGGIGRRSQTQTKGGATDEGLTFPLHVRCKSLPAYLQELEISAQRKTFQQEVALIERYQLLKSESGFFGYITTLLAFMVNEKPYNKITDKALAYDLMIRVEGIIRYTTN